MAAATDPSSTDEEERTCMFCAQAQAPLSHRNNLIRATCCQDGWYHERCINERIQRAVRRQNTQVKCARCQSVMQYRFEPRTWEDFQEHLRQLCGDGWRWLAYATLMLLAGIDFIFVVVTHALVLEPSSTFRHSTWMFWLSITAYLPLMPWPLPRALHSLSLDKLTFDRPGQYSRQPTCLSSATADQALELTRVCFSLAAAPILILMYLIGLPQLALLHVALALLDVLFFLWCVIRLRTMLYNLWSVYAAHISLERVAGEPPAQLLAIQTTTTV